MSKEIDQKEESCRERIEFLRAAGFEVSPATQRIIENERKIAYNEGVRASMEKLPRKNGPNFVGHKCQCGNDIYCQQRDQVIDESYKTFALLLQEEN